MKLDDLLSLFNKQGVPDYFYAIGGLGSGECYGIEERKDTWAIYYSERGEKNLLSIHASEDEVCNELFRHISRMMQEEFDKPLKLK